MAKKLPVQVVGAILSAVQTEEAGHIHRRMHPQSVIWITEAAVAVSYRGGMPFDAETLGLMRQVLDDICRDVPVGENHVRTFVATALLDCANTGERSLGALKQAAGAALLEIYSDSRTGITSGRVIRS